MDRTRVSSFFLWYWVSSWSLFWWYWVSSLSLFWCYWVSSWSLFWWYWVSSWSLFWCLDVSKCCSHIMHNILISAFSSVYWACAVGCFSKYAACLIRMCTRWWVNGLDIWKTILNSAQCVNLSLLQCTQPKNQQQHRPEQWQPSAMVAWCLKRGLGVCLCEKEICI